MDGFSLYFLLFSSPLYKNGGGKKLPQKTVAGLKKSSSFSLFETIAFNRLKR
ncbi:Hypothetical protein Minf_2162 [Methylacidiphilum infernorum V4]|uniref:Uncharacterized protein n=1 Tax=Methylacidiphilum infernorum (isolate V4) TaxID=481448 RepID=B3DZN1_METI4|nr:Hypothetical protein Minf_2162 [Methylacidiphilum infernorum V4]